MAKSKSGKKKIQVPEPSLHRLPCYLAYLKMEHLKGSRYVSSKLIARYNGVAATQVIKDLAHTGFSGKTKVGYEVDPLINALEDFLGFQEMSEACLFGAGSLGTALLHDHGLIQYGLKITAAYDIDTEIIGKKIGGVEIHHLNDFIQNKNQSIHIGILTVPLESARDTAQIMIKNGIRAIWNFTPVRMTLPDHIVVQNTSLYAHLAVIFNRLKSNEKGDSQ